MTIVLLGKAEDENEFLHRVIEREEVVEERIVEESKTKQEDIKKKKTRFTWEDWGLQEKNASSKSSPNLKVSLKKQKKDKKNMKQLKVIDMIAKIEEETEKNEIIEKKYKKIIPDAALSPTSSSVRRTGGRIKIEKHDNFDNLGLGSTRKKDGRKFNLRTSLTKIINKSSEKD